MVKESKQNQCLGMLSICFSQKRMHVLDFLPEGMGSEGEEEDLEQPWYLQ